MTDKNCKFDRDPKTSRFVNGNSGGPGRPKGSSRKELAREFLEDMRKIWAEKGPEILARVVEDDPATFLRSMVAIMPKELDMTVNRYDEMTDDQLKDQLLAALGIARELGIDIGIEDAPKVH